MYGKTKFDSLFLFFFFYFPILLASRLENVLCFLRLKEFNGKKNKIMLYSDTVVFIFLQIDLKENICCEISAYQRKCTQHNGCGWVKAAEK